eukprot:scaffold37715_cov56-Phaeocystis_antarctica.AAC.2
MRPQLTKSNAPRAPRASLAHKIVGKWGQQGCRPLWECRHKTGPPPSRPTRSYFLGKLTSPSKLSDVKARCTPYVVILNIPARPRAACRRATPARGAAWLKLGLGFGLGSGLGLGSGSGLGLGLGLGLGSELGFGSGSNLAISRAKRTYSAWDAFHATTCAQGSAPRVG